MTEHCQFLVQSCTYRIKDRKAKTCHAPALVHQELDLVDKILRDLFTEEVDRLVIDNRQEYLNMRERLEHSSPELLEKVHLYTD